MSALDLQQSRSLLAQVVQTLYGERHSPVPGALVKARMTREASYQGASFSERELGFRSFVDFVKATPGIGLQIRIGSDMLLAPSSANEILSAYAHPLPRLRRDFWRAFIEFPVPNTVRLYDAAEDKILYEDATTQKQGIPIEPVSRDTQIQWRQQFAEEQPDNIKSALFSAVEGTGASPFNDFARRLRENPSVMHAWNRYLQKLVTDRAVAWATAHNIPAERWRGGARFQTRIDGSLTEAASQPQSISQRAELHNFFDNVPIEDLLQLRVPLEWVLKVTRDKR
jgi:hypothetical protein